MVTFGCGATGGSCGTGDTYGCGCWGGVLGAAAGGVYATVGGMIGCGAGGTGFAACVAESVWKIEAPHFGQKEASGFSSAWQLGQSVLGATSDLPQPVQKVSPAS